jgi:hypothetical protein
MYTQSSDHTSIFPEISDERVIELITQEFPLWKIACDRVERKRVTLYQEAFGKSLNDSFVLHLAIRYAGMMGKTVIIKLRLRGAPNSSTV